MLVLPFRKTLRFSQWLSLLLLGFMVSTSVHAQTCEDALGGTVYVGSGAGSPAYANFKELYDDINARGLASNLSVLVQSDVTETATALLNTVAYPCDNTGLSITIQPADAEEYIISATNAAVMMQLNGVTNLTIDGSYEGSGRYLLFRHTTAAQSVLTLSNGTHNCQIKNTIMEGSGASTAIMRLGTGSGLAITHITIDGNYFRNRSDIAQTAANLHRISIVSVGGSATERNEHITVTNNLFAGFSQSGVDFGTMTSISNAGNMEYYLGSSAFAGTNNGAYFNISNNRFFAPITLSSGHVFIPIKFNPGGASHSNIISGNIIGGSDELNNGSLVYTSDNGFSGIYVSVGGSSEEEATIISDNIIQNINLSRTGNTWQRFVGIETVGVSRVKILNNTVGSLSQSNSITANSNGFSSNYQFISWMYGIWHYSTSDADVIGNIVSNMSSTAASGTTATSGIRVGARENWAGVAPTTLIVIVPGRVRVNDNIVANLTTPSKSWRSTTSMAPQHPGALSGIVVISNSQNNEVNNNQVYNLHNTVAGSNHRSTCVVAIAVDGSGPQGHEATGVISGNIIYNLKNDHQNNTNNNDRPEIIGISLGMMIGVTTSGTTQGRGSYVLTNNMISLAPEVPSNSTTVVGIMDQIQAPSTTTVYNNTVYIGGTGLNSLHPTAAYLKFPNRGRSGFTDGASSVYNNIFVNERAGMTNSYAMALSVNSSPVNYQGDNNFLASTATGQMALWQGAAGTLAAWRTATGGKDMNSVSARTVSEGNSSTTTINPDELFVDKYSDLHLILTPESAYPHAFVYGTGQPIAGVSEDIDEESRHALYPCMGADEIELPCTELEFVTDLPAVHVGCYDGNTSLYAQVEGSFPQFVTWEMSTNGGATWTTVNNGGKYSGAKTTTLTISNPTVAMIGYKYRVTVSNMCSSLSSTVATLDLQVCPPNDNPSNTNPSLTHQGYVYPNNVQVTGSTAGATVNPLTGTRDVWYRMQAFSNGVSIKVSSNVIDPIIYLFDDNDMSAPLDVENLIEGTGTEILNYDGLVEGNLYRIAIASASEVDGNFSIVVQQLRKPECSANTELSLCGLLHTSVTGAHNVVYSFTDVLTDVTTTYSTSNNYAPLNTTSLGLGYGRAYTTHYTAYYNLQNGLGEPETIVVPNTESCNIVIGPHKEVVVKANNRCSSGAVFNRTGYLTGEYIGTGGQCNITGFEFEFTPVANCAGDDPQVLDKFIKPLTSNTPYISLNYVFNAVPLANNPNLGYWSVRIRPRYNGHTGEWGTPYVIAVNGTAPVTNMAMNDAPVASVLTTAESIESSIYPNPNTGEMVNLNITGITSNEVYVRVLDSMGREVYTNRYSVDGSLNTMVNFTRPLAQGVYMVEITAGDEVKTQRMVVAK